ncbi:hypothetical protein VN97_g3979 [Penicillium thymicola]|uniref:Uncharacterized protein n=1 Tax=Penicillium thymicola TaxID=293382 RepID=A0AAI9XAB0_PENTH|nr:hypothetical protein VN97_g3979 [Penicillium thymicola]
MLVQTPNEIFKFIDFHESVPAAACQDMYKDVTNASLYGGLEGTKAVLSKNPTCVTIDNHHMLSHVKIVLYLLAFFVCFLLCLIECYHA